MNTINTLNPAADLLAATRDQRFGCILADPPWQFVNRTGKMAPEHKRLSRYGTMDLAAISALPMAKISAPTSHLYLWVPNALLPEGLQVMKAWGFTYKSNIVWHKLRKDRGSDGRGVGFYFRNVTEMVLFGVRGENARTLQPGRTQVNYLGTRKREHSRKPDELYPLIEACSAGPRIEMFARGARPGWIVWGNQAVRITSRLGTHTRTIRLLSDGASLPRLNSGPSADFGILIISSRRWGNAPLPSALPP